MKPLFAPQRALCSLSVAALAVFAGQAQAVVVYSSDFESGLGPEYNSGAGAVIGTGGYSAYAFGSFYLHNATAGNPADSSVLTLGGLPSHSSLTLTFDLAVIDSWDGGTILGGTDDAASPDSFNVKVNGVVVFSETFDNFDAADQSYAGPAIVYSDSDLGHNNDFRDSAYAISLTIPDTSSGLTVEWYAGGGGWEAGDDESWAVDNVNVSVAGTTSVPEGGSTLLLLGLTLAGPGCFHLMTRTPKFPTAPSPNRA